MLSYRHAFHAGNFADLLKHLVLVQCLRHLNAKDKPWLYVDTHAGAGRYALREAPAQRTGEAAAGIERLWQADTPPAALAELRELVRAANGGPALKHYPGSPWLAHHLARPGDSLRLAEMHSTDFALLRRLFADDTRRVTVSQSDGFALLKAALPPPSRRGLVLIDPSYEIKTDYGRVVAAVKDALVRFATGTYAIWHPLLPLADAHHLPERLKKAGAADWLHVTLAVSAPARGGRGMHGSGMFVINPPWTLAQTLRDTLPWLTDLLAQDERAAWTLDAHEADAAPNAR